MAQQAPKLVIDLAPVDSDGQRLLDDYGDPGPPEVKVVPLEPHEVVQKEQDERDGAAEDQERADKRRRREAAQRVVREQAKSDPAFAALAELLLP